MFLESHTSFYVLEGRIVAMIVAIVAIDFGDRAGWEVCDCSFRFHSALSTEMRMRADLRKLRDSARISSKKSNHSLF